MVQTLYYITFALFYGSVYCFSSCNKHCICYDKEYVVTCEGKSVSELSFTGYWKEYMKRLYIENTEIFEWRFLHDLQNIEVIGLKNNVFLFCSDIISIPKWITVYTDELCNTSTVVDTSSFVHEDITHTINTTTFTSEYNNVTTNVNSGVSTFNITLTTNNINHNTSTKASVPDADNDIYTTTFNNKEFTTIQNTSKDRISTVQNISIVNFTTSIATTSSYMQASSLSLTLKEMEMITVSLILIISLITIIFICITVMVMTRKTTLRRNDVGKNKLKTICIHNVVVVIFV